MEDAQVIEAEGVARRRGSGLFIPAAYFLPQAWISYQHRDPENSMLLKARYGAGGCSSVMEDRQKLQEMLERYRTILRMTADPQAIEALEQLIRETLDRLDELDPVDDRISDKGC